MKTWFSLLCTNIIYCLVHLLLLGQQTGPPPKTGLCLLQAGLMYAAPPTLAAAATIFVLELYLRLVAAVRGTQFKEGPIYVMIWGLPAVPTIIFWVDGLIGVFNLAAVKRRPNGLFCHIEMYPPTLITGATTTLLILGMLWFEVLIIILLARQGCFEAGEMGNVKIGDGFPRSLFVRMIVISVTGLGAVIAIAVINLENLQGDPSSATLISLAIMPLSVSGLLLTQKDILAFYCGLRTRRDPYDASRLA